MHRTPRLPIPSAALLLLVLVSSPVPPATAQTDGPALYAKYCSQCHGDSGDGKGIATRFMKPAPRDFTAGKYKVRTTPTGGLPTDDDLRHIIRAGLPYSAMPAFSNFTDAELDAIVQHIKTFSADFEDPEAKLPPIPLPEPPAYSEASAAHGKELYEATGCGRCHGVVGRGDGTSAPTLRDDWGHHIRVADLSMPWTFRGGGSRRDIFRTMSTGFNGTPMPGFHGALPEADIWGIVDYIASLSGNSSEAPYSNLLTATGTDQPLDFEALDDAAVDELFAADPGALFPLVGQIIEPGRNFHPQVYAVRVQALFNRKEIAFRVSWHDMRAETGGHNAPDLEAPLWDDELAATGEGASPAGDGEAEGGGFWGDLADDSGSSAGSEGGGFWGDLTTDEEPADGASGGDDFWGDEEVSTTPAASGPDTEFSDAVALQFPLEMPAGVRLPYFLFGDSQNAVQLWYADLAQPSEPRLYTGRGSGSLSVSDTPPPALRARYADGEWSVVFKRERKATTGLSFEESRFVPIAVSVWNGFNRERGNKRAVTTWYHLYLPPLERPSTVKPMLKAGLGVLGAELLLIGLVRLGTRRKRTP